MSVRYEIFSNNNKLYSKVKTLASARRIASRLHSAKIIKVTEQQVR